MLPYFLGSYIFLSLLPVQGSLAKRRDDSYFRYRAGQLEKNRMYSLSQLAELWNISEYKTSRTILSHEKERFYFSKWQ